MTNVALALLTTNETPPVVVETHGRERCRSPVQILLEGDGPPALGPTSADLTSSEILRRLLSPLLAHPDNGRVADELLARFGSLGAILTADTTQLGNVVSNKVVDHLQTTYFVCQRALRDHLPDRPAIGSWSALEDYAAIRLRLSPSEKLMTLFLDRGNGLIHEECLEQGAFDETPAYCREIVRRALELHAHAVALAHNHPAGDPTPSRGDVEISKRIVSVLSSLGIVFHDHAIVGRNTIVSLRSMRFI